MQNIFSELGKGSQGKPQVSLHAMSIIEIPVEVNPDGSYVQMKDRMRIRFEPINRTELPEPAQLPTTVDWNKVFEGWTPSTEIVAEEVHEEVQPTIINEKEIDEIYLMPLLDFSQKHVRNPNGPTSLRMPIKRERAGRFTRR